MKNGSLLTIALLFVFTTSLFAQPSGFEKFWNQGGTPGAWNTGTNWDPNDAPDDGDDVLIADPATATVTISVANALADGIMIGYVGDSDSTGSLTITGTLTTDGSSAGNGSDGVHLHVGSTGKENSLTVNGSLIVSGCNGDGIDINPYTSFSIGGGGSFTFNGHGGGAANGDDAIEIQDDFTNAGTVSITNPADGGITVKTDADEATLTNTGTMTISGTGAAGGVTGNGITLDVGTSFTNTGTVIISNAIGNLVDGSGSFINNGTFKGDGTIDPTAFNFGTGTLAPGTSVGTITFNAATTFTSTSKVEFEINGTNDYDKIIVNGNLNLNGVTLIRAGTHPPAMGESFTLIELTGGGVLSGTFAGIAEGGAVTWNGVTVYISYMGNQVTANFDAPLPVELIDFNARPMDDEVKLSWTTANEENNDYFTLERSVDGRNFEPIGMIFGNGNTTEISKYIHMDDNPARGLNYYRLKQTDYDGSFSYSDIETAEFEEDETIKVYPTVAHDILTIVSDSDLKADLKVVIRDLRGREYRSFVISSNKNKREISLNDLVPGSYFVAIYDNEKVSTFKIIKL